jgi:hypothetical protein
MVRGDIYRMPIPDADARIGDGLKTNLTDPRDVSRARGCEDHVK